MIRQVRTGALLPLLLGSTWLLPLPLPLAGCGDAEPDQSGAAEIGVRMFFVQSEGCAELPAGKLPDEAAQVLLQLFPNVADASPLQEVALAVDPLARCRDSQGREFACPFDLDGDGMRERYFAFDPRPLGSEVVLLVMIKDGQGEIRWTGRSEPVRPAARGATVVSVVLRPSSAQCR
ncbi:MAG: hypothetical protein FJ125_06675 [Deltaproteobacteria bacterium]|nr:hypothetical protein [Deltaproteobacteria bacterium]